MKGEIMEAEEAASIAPLNVVGEWVACAEEMPDDEIAVLVWFGEGDATIAHHDTEILERKKDSGWIQAGTNRRLRNVSHWCREIIPPLD